MTPEKTAFATGFALGLKLWNEGLNTEAILTLEACNATAHGQGMFASCEALNGWLDSAERIARKCGHTRPEAFELVQTATVAK